MEKAKVYPWERQQESLVLDTPEQTRVEYRVAGFGSRIVAAMIDRAIILFGIFVLGAFAVLILGGAASLNEQLGGYALAFIIVLYFLLTLLYYAVGEIRGEGRTWGKRWLKLRTVMATGQGITVGASLIRNLARLADEIPIMWLVPSFVPGRRRMGDILAGTFVIDETPERRRRRDWLSQLAPSHRDLTDRQYHITGEMARRLYADDLNLIEYLDEGLGQQSAQQRARSLRQVALRYVERLELVEDEQRIVADPERFLQELGLFLRDRFDRQAY